MSSNAYKAGPVFTEVRYDTLEEARAVRLRMERAYGISLPKSKEEIRLEQEIGSQ